MSGSTFIKLGTAVIILQAVAKTDARLGASSDVTLHAIKTARASMSKVPYMDRPQVQLRHTVEESPFPLLPSEPVHVLQPMHEVSCRSMEGLDQAQCSIRDTPEHLII